VDMKEKPLISIVTPSFNQSQFLEATIESILSQNYLNLEYIIIDGGSTDGSIDIIKKYEKYLSFWCSEPDGGQYDAINKGFSHSRGEIMSWLNSDDMYLPWTFKTVSDIMTNLPQVDWLTTLNPGNWDYHDFCTGFISAIGFSLEAFLDGCYIPLKSQEFIGIQQESTFWKRSLWEVSGGYISTDFKLASDFDLWARFYIHSNLYGTISPLGGFRNQCNQKSLNIEEYIKEAKLSLTNMRQGLDFKPNIVRNLLLFSRFRKIPKLNKLIASIYGYNGKKIIRKNADKSDGFWAIEDYNF
jgi:glycosyltransferase involved in cell wall biosynthesis